jgi:hypothetical protein
MIAATGCAIGPFPGGNEVKWPEVFGGFFAAGPGDSYNYVLRRRAKSAN